MVPPIWSWEDPNSNCGACLVVLIRFLRSPCYEVPMGNWVKLGLGKQKNWVLNGYFCGAQWGILDCSEVLFIAHPADCTKHLSKDWLAKSGVLSVHIWEEVSLLCSSCSSCGIAFTQPGPQKQRDLPVRQESSCRSHRPGQILFHGHTGIQKAHRIQWNVDLSLHSLGAWLLNLTKLGQHLKGLTPREFVQVSCALWFIWINFYWIFCPQKNLQSRHH